ncbi:MAG: aspartate dehydrogenase [Methanomassiliicoccales archaeon]|nr:aspartate dehydrogenase [Methanomassiliicoccales archaeon]
MVRNRMRLLIIGCGSIGTTLAKAVDEMPEVDLIYITDKSKVCAAHLVEKLHKVKYVDNSDECLSDIINDIDLVVEAASQEAARHFVPFFLERGVDVMMMSVGAFADDDFREKCFKLSKEKGCRLFVPSGAITGTDGLRSASAGEIDEVTLITTKGPKSLRSIEYFKQKGIDIERIKEPTVVFEGSARDAARIFPRNMNIAATLSLLGIGFDRTKVKIVCDPNVERNTHTLIVKGPFGEITSTTSNVPFPRNPSTSYLAALSAIAALKRIINNVWIGV